MIMSNNLLNNEFNWDSIAKRMIEVYKWMLGQHEKPKDVKNKDSDDIDNRPASVIAREKMMADSQNAWKGGDK